jgi:hypothetical protein
MSDPTHISSLIGDIYDAILDQSLWTGVLGKATQFIGAQAGALLWRNTVDEAADVVLTSGVEPHYVELYTEHYAKAGRSGEARGRFRQSSGYVI